MKESEKEEHIKCESKKKNDRTRERSKNMKDACLGEPSPLCT